jgi:hypothetical protein
MDEKKIEINAGIEAAVPTPKEAEERLRMRDIPEAEGGPTKPPPKPVPLPVLLVGKLKGEKGSADCLVRLDRGLPVIDDETVKPPLPDGRYTLTILDKPDLPPYAVQRFRRKWVQARNVKRHPTLTDDQVDEQVGREMALVVQAVGGNYTGAHVVAWAKANPDSILYWMMDWSPGVTDEQRIALFDKAAAEGVGPIRL